VKRIWTPAQLEGALATSAFLLFMHSLLCERSVAAFQECQHWSAQNPALGAGWIDVESDSFLAREASERTGVTLEFPQAVFLRNGRPSWSAKNAAITRAGLGCAFGWPLPAR
jgi:bacillithiol system protein YtxJ